MIYIKNFKIIACFCFFYSQCLSGYVFKPVMKAKEAILIDARSGAILISHNPHKKTAPSSLTKIAAIVPAFEGLASGVFKPTQKFTVSHKAYAKGGSRMFLEQKSNVTLDNLLKGIIVSSGNDAAITLAEGIAGKEGTYASMMTAYANKIGARNTNFINACGWPDKNHYSTVYDLALIAKDVIERFPKLYQEYFTLKEFTYNKIKQYNRNKLLWNKNNSFHVDGMKTGHTKDGGFGLVFSAIKRGDNPTRLIGVINGLNSEAERIEEAGSLLRWAANQHKTAKIMAQNKVYFDIPVMNGVKKEIKVISQKDYYYTSHVSKLNDINFKLEFLKRQAPIAKGEHIANLHVEGTLKSDLTIPLYAEESIETAGVFSRIYSKLKGFFITQKKIEYKAMMDQISSKLLSENKKEMITP